MVAENEQPVGGAETEDALRTCGPVQGPKRDNLIVEAEALVNYVASHGTTDLNVTNGVERLKELAEAVELANAKARPEPIDERWTRLVVAYEQLASVTYVRWGVNGRTILDTRGRLVDDDSSGWLRFVPRVKKRNMVVISGLLLATMGISLEVLVELSAVPSGALAMSEEFKAVLKAVGHFAMPAAWGGLGACVFLAKRMSDKLYQMQYEEARTRGYGTRIFLGSTIGVVTASIAFPDLDTHFMAGSTGLAPPAVAFVAGLSVKPVYAAFEALSEGIAARIAPPTEDGNP
jgi:hypothetical protein